MVVVERDIVVNPATCNIAESVVVFGHVYEQPAVSSLEKKKCQIFSLYLRYVRDLLCHCEYVIPDAVDEYV